MDVPLCAIFARPASVWALVLPQQRGGLAHQATVGRHPCGAQGRDEPRQVAGMQVMQPRTEEIENAPGQLALAQAVPQPSCQPMRVGSSRQPSIITQVRAKMIGCPRRAIGLTENSQPKPTVGREIQPGRDVAWFGPRRREVSDRFVLFPTPVSPLALQQEAGRASAGCFRTADPHLLGLRQPKARRIE